MRVFRTLVIGATLGAALTTGALTTGALAQEAPKRAKNVIVMISDGASPNTWKAASYYRYGVTGREVYDKFDVKLYASTHPLNQSNTPTLSNEGAVTFDPEAVWGDAKDAGVYTGGLGSYDSFFDGYSYARASATDSAAAATALASGHKTYNNAINWSNDDTRLKHIGEYTVDSGRALGVISSVPWTHATPAGFLAHNKSRHNYADMAREIVSSGMATVVMGSGNPDFDNDGKPVNANTDTAFRYVGGKETWQALKAGKTPYHLIETKADFEALANGKLNFHGKSKILGTAQTANTLQYSRSGFTGGDLLENQPDLATMTRGALNVLSKDEDGFFLMVEGGAVDWAAHANNLPRLIEEQIDFNLAVEAAVKWVEANSSWEDTLIIVTTDHGNGLLLGPDSGDKAYSPIISQGAGALPLVRWHTDNHTRELVPLFAKGAGSDYFLKVAKRHDGLARHKVPESSWYYVDNTDVFKAAANAFGVEVKD
ncbi:MAG: alkaline phosphatase [Asticcacaulis sp.]